MAVLNRKLKAATLVEVMIAMVLLMASFAIGSMVYFSILRSSHNQMRFQAKLLLEEKLTVTKQQKNFFDANFEQDPVFISRRMMPYQQSQQLGLLWLQATDKNGKILAEVKEVIILE